MELLNNTESVIQNPYKIDLDENGFLALTDTNARFICAAYRLDSKYRKSFDEYDLHSAFYYIIQNANKIEGNYEVLKEICTRLDRENSTHLSVSGNREGDSHGIENTAKAISKIRDLKKELKNGSPQLVDIIASAVDKRNNLSFATKFCAFMCRFLFRGMPEADNYCIYDNVLASIIPYYAWIFNGIKYIKRSGRSNIEGIFKDKHNYIGYRELIDAIRVEASKKYNYLATREEFDAMLWYYYKGNNDLINSAYERIRAEN